MISYKNKKIGCDYIRSKKIILVSHCVLNQNAVINDWERAKGAFSISKILINEGVGIIQLPCPELIFYGTKRLPLEYDDYNIPKYRILCRELAKPFIEMIEKYLDDDYKFLGIIGINNSPTCSITNKRGVFMEEMFAICKAKDIEIPFVEIPENYKEIKEDKELEIKIKELISV